MCYLRLNFHTNDVSLDKKVILVTVQNARAFLDLGKVSGKRGMEGAVLCMCTWIWKCVCWRSVWGGWTGWVVNEWDKQLSLAGIATLWCGALCGVLLNSKSGGLKLTLEMCVLSAYVVFAFAMVTSLYTVRCVSAYTVSALLVWSLIIFCEKRGFTLSRLLSYLFCPWN